MLGVMCLEIGLPVSVFRIKKLVFEMVHLVFGWVYLVYGMLLLEF